ncbi:hypothetical protein Ancab_020909, partial [Ancistrocladus abbreviatus]
IRDYRGFPVIAAAYRLDDCENVFFAEAEALRKGLELAKSLDIEDLYIEGDSTEVINRVKGAIHVKNPSKDAKIGVIKQELEQSFNFRKIELVNRDANKVADALGNIASHGKSWIPKGGRIWNKQDFPGSFPDRVLSCVKEDIDGTNLSLMWRSVRMMRAPGRPGVVIPINVFAKNPMLYFQNLRASRPIEEIF